MSRAVLIVTLLVLAANLRPTITAYGSVVGLIGADTGLSPAALGVLGAVPLLAFGVVSPFVAWLSQRIGSDRSILVATVVLIIGTALRSLPGGGVVSLWAGTAIVGSAIAVCNVVVPAIVKRDFPRDVALLTGLYTAVLSTTAALASGLALPIAASGGWRLGIGIWGLLSVLALAAWLFRLPGMRAEAAAVAPPPRATTGRSMWSSAVAWQVTLFMGAQAIGFYLLVTWLPTIEVSFGVDPVAAGWHSFVYQIVGIAAGLAVSVLMRGRTDHRLVGAVISALLMLAMGGLILAPALSLLWLVLAGLSGGSSLVIALTLVSERARSPADASRLSGMAQSVGYLIAAAGPVGAGLLFQASGTWVTSLLAVIGIGAAQLVVALYAGRDRFTHPTHHPDDRIA